jgi:anaerobic selenocysteine-containing dehydrogenase
MNEQTIRTTHYRACHLCEAICGLKIETEGVQQEQRIISIKGDEHDPFSRGHICPKAIALQDMHGDPDRLKLPVKKVDAAWQQISWEQAFDEIAQSVAEIQGREGNDSLAVYAGNPNVHNYGNLTHGRMLRKALGTKQNYSATSLDQLPHHFAAYFLYGHQFLIPVPDIDRTKFMVIMGGNPLASNGSMMTVPDVKKRLKSIQERGGKFVVIDPRRTETADIADSHLFIKPGTDIFLLLGMINYMFNNERVRDGHLTNVFDGLAEVEQSVAGFSLAIVSAQTGIPANQLIDLFDAFCAQPESVFYGRMGVSVQQHGSLCQWAIQVINLLNGSVDVPGGAMVPSSAIAYVQPGEPGSGHYNLFQTRVRGLPEFGGELPVSALAEEMLTPGEGQLKALFTLAGNPVLSSPNGRQLDQALEKLDLMVSLDFYINETTQHADYILPPTAALEHDHYDIAFHRLAVRDTARFNEPVFEPEAGTKHDWEILNGLSIAIAAAKGQSLRAMPAPDILMDMGLQMGPYSKKAGSAHALNLAKLKANPHGIDLGPLKEGLLKRLCTENKRINLAVEILLSAINKIALDSGHERDFPLTLIGRRHVRSNNSWMHNYHRLVKGKPRHHCFVHSSDLNALNLVDGEEVILRSRVNEIKVQIEMSDEVMPGVVCLPHGWGHDRQGIKLEVAERHAGVSFNDVSDDQACDPVTGNAILNGIPCGLYKLN